MFNYTCSSTPALDLLRDRCSFGSRGMIVVSLIILYDGQKCPTLIG